jgi:hypothetical protein
MRIVHGVDDQRQAQDRPSDGERKRRGKRRRWDA